MKSAMSELMNKYQGYPAAVLGGGPSLPADMKHLPKDCLLISVNHHAFLLCEPDFIVYNDQPSTDPDMECVVKSCEAIRVSPDPTSDVEFDVPVWTGFTSSNTGAWLALWMGCNPVILCGMDLYQGEKKYFHPCPKKDVPAFNLNLADHLRPWIEEARGSCPNIDRLKAMSGPLVDVFGKYEVAR